MQHPKEELVATAAATTVIISAEAAEKKNDDYNPDNPFAAVVTVISKAHNSSSFQI